MHFPYSQKTIQLQADKSIYFASDFHFGVPDAAKSRDRERKVVQWLETIRKDAQVIFLVGDLFDFWFEYKQVVPKGYVRFLGKLAELSDEGIEIVVFTGNHDMWMRDYLEQELNAVVSRHPISYQIQMQNQTIPLLVGHGDGLGPGDATYKRLKILFESPLARWGFRQLHPDIALRIANAWSRSSRLANNQKGEDHFKGPSQEWLYLFCQEMEQLLHHDLYVFGHRHLVIDMPVETPQACRYINLGEWVNDSYYFQLNHQVNTLKKWVI